MLEVAYMLNEQFTYLAMTFFGNPTFNSHFKFLKGLGFFFSLGTLSHSFGPIEDAVSMPYLSVHGMLRLHLD